MKRIGVLPRFRDGSNSFAQPYEEIVQLKSPVADGKNYRTDVAIAETPKQQKQAEASPSRRANGSNAKPASR